MFSPHFGHTREFAIYQVEDGKILSKHVLDTDGAGHGALAGFLKAQGADVLLCGGIGPGAQQALKEAGICFYGGVTGSADAAAQAYLDGTLQYDPEAKCSNPSTTMAITIIKRHAERMAVVGMGTSTAVAITNKKNGRAQVLRPIGT